MLAYVKEQPQIWQDALEGTLGDAQGAAKALFEKGITRLIATGSGSSYHAALSAKKAFRDLASILIQTAVPTRAEEAFFEASPNDTAVLFLSQSGESTATIKALKSAKESGFFCLGITQKPDSSIARLADLFIPLRCGEESVGPKTKGFTVTVLSLTLLAAAMGKCNGGIGGAQIRHLKSSLNRSFALAQENIEASLAFVQKHRELLCRAAHMQLIAEGQHFPLLLEGALKILETLYIPVHAYEFEEYLHGIQLSLSRESVLIMIVPPGEKRARMLKLCAYVRALGAHCLLIAMQEPIDEEDALLIKSGGDDLTFAFESILPMQALAAQISQAKGIDCDKPRFPDFYGALDTKTQTP